MTDINSLLMFINSLNNSKVFAGIAMIIMNIGSRYVLNDLTQVHERIMSSMVFKKIILFCIFFVGTRDVMIAIILTFAFTIALEGLLNETKRYNILPSIFKNQPSISEKDYHTAKMTVHKYESSIKSQHLPAKAHNIDTMQSLPNASKSKTDIYFDAIEQLELKKNQTTY